MNHKGSAASIRPLPLARRFRDLVPGQPRVAVDLIADILQSIDGSGAFGPVGELEVEMWEPGGRQVMATSLELLVHDAEVVIHVPVEIDGTISFVGLFAEVAWTASGTVRSNRVVYEVPPDVTGWQEGLNLLAATIGIMRSLHPAR